MDIIKTCRELLAIEQELPNHCVNFGQYFPKHFRMETFEQVWNNTSGGFESIGGDALTCERTYVFIPYPEIDEPCQVYFGSRYAYSVSTKCEQFMDDVCNHRVAGYNTAKKNYDRFSRIS